MRRHVWPILLALHFGCASTPSSPVRPRAAATSQLSTPTPAARDLVVWREFVARLRADSLTVADVDPYPELAHLEGFRETLLGFLRKMAASARWEEWARIQEAHRVGENLHVIAHLSEGEGDSDYVFTFRDADSRWYFRHLEAITVRLDRIGALPTSEFPDVKPTMRLWMAEEKRVTEQVRLFGFLEKEKGRDFALNWFKDGRGYFVGVKTWVPYLEPGRAFVLYLCFEQSRLRGDEVTLRRLDTAGAEVHLRSNYLRMHDRTAHIKNMISLADFRALFEAEWRDRADKAGWLIQFEYGPDGAVDFRLTRAVH